MTTTFDNSDLLSELPVESGHLTIMPVSVIDIMAQGKRLGYSVRVHENLLVFKKAG
jgi:hypothetical protein